MGITCYGDNALCIYTSLIFGDFVDHLNGNPVVSEVTMFLNREEELGELKQVLSSNESELVNMYGKRRLGKTELLTEITKQIGTKFSVLYYQFTEVPSDFQLNELSEILKSLYPQDSTLQAAQIMNWEGFFNLIMALEQLICIFDEFPYLVEVDSSIPSILQKVWDKSKKKSRTKIVLCGSYVSIMEDIMGKGQPLYGRFTKLIPINPFTFLGMREFFSGLDFKKQITLYLIFGGNPYYLDSIKEKASKDLNQLLVETTFSKYSFFSQEIPLEFRTFSQKPYQYIGVLHAITSGKTSLSKISDAIKISARNTPRILQTLIGLNIVKRIDPFLTARFKKPVQYQISDPYTRFWMKYLVKFPRYPKNYVDTVVIPSLDDFLSKPGFEEFCKEALDLLSSQNKLSDLLENFHTFNDEIPIEKKKKSVEIDIIAFGNKTIIFGECKWTNNSPQIGELSHFLDKCQTFINYSKVRYKFPIDKFQEIIYVFFSREDSKLTNIPSELSTIHLVSLSTLENWIDSPPNPSVKFF